MSGVPMLTGEPEDARRSPVVEAVPAGSPRPVWSVMIPTFNCAAYLAQTLEAVLAQDPGPESMQIEVVDDGSTRDDPELVASSIGRGRVGFFRQPVNVGHVQNFNTCLKRARGHLVHLLHGDDLALPGFYATMQRVFALHREIGAAFCRDVRIDERGEETGTAAPLAAASGVLEGWLEIIAAGQRLQPPGMVVRREVYEAVGGFDPRISCYGEDWEMWVRIAARYPVWYERKPLAAYRIHAGSLTARSRVAANAADYRRAIDINRAHLPAGRADDLSRLAAVNFARACIRRGWRALGTGGVRVSVQHFREALRTSCSLLVLVEFLEHGARFCVGLSKRIFGMSGSARKRGADGGRKHV